MTPVGVEGVSPSYQEGGEARSTGRSSPRLEDAAATRMSRDGASGGELRLASRVTFSSPESMEGSPYRSNQGQRQSHLRQTSRSSDASPTIPTTNERARYASQDSAITVNGKGGTALGISQQSTNSDVKSNRAWKGEKHR